MAALKDTDKVFVVTRLACFAKPTEIADELKQRGIDVSLAQLSIYDPNHRAGKRLSSKLRELFEETRKQFLEDVSAIPISHKAMRVRELAKMLEKAQASGRSSPKLQLEILEQIAKECGDAYTNRREITGKGGQPLAVKTEVTTKPNLKRLPIEKLEALEEILACAETEDEDESSPAKPG
ncbi:MAG: DUF2280 domain-containing protein [Patescibacteria group bacterium]|nr:DUF2280 domain-containing protein [Patescibacteria group bacterium]